MVKHQKCLQPATIQLSVDIEFQGSHLTSDAKKIQCTFHSMKVEGVQWGVARHPVASIRSPLFLGKFDHIFHQLPHVQAIIGMSFFVWKTLRIKQHTAFQYVFGVNRALSPGSLSFVSSQLFFDPKTSP